MTGTAARRPLLRLVLGSLAMMAATAAHATCATSVAELRAVLQDPFFPLVWEETETRDPRPLLVTLDDRPGGLFISFRTSEGLLAEGPARICQVEDRVEARFLREGLQLGPSASLLLKTALRAGAAVRLQRTGEERMRIGSFGWTGEFVPSSPRVGLKTNFGAL